MIVGAVVGTLLLFGGVSCLSRRRRAGPGDAARAGDLVAGTIPIAAGACLMTFATALTATR